MFLLVLYYLRTWMQHLDVFADVRVYTVATYSAITNLCFKQALPWWIKIDGILIQYAGFALCSYPCYTCVSACEWACVCVHVLCYTHTQTNTLSLTSRHKRICTQCIYAWAAAFLPLKQAHLAATPKRWAHTGMHAHEPPTYRHIYRVTEGHVVIHL